MQFIRLYFLPFLIVILFSNLSHSQEKIEVTVVNAEDLTPVPFATISFPELKYGFSTNGNGQFILPLDKTYENQMLAVTNIGFETFQKRTKDLINTDTIFLQPKVTVLSEIVVRAKKENPEDLVKNVEKELGNFLRKDSYYLYGFYTETIQKNEKYEGYTEAYGVFNIAGYQPGYNRKNPLFSYDIAQWKNMRRSNYSLSSECDTKRQRTLEIDKLSKAKSEYLYNGPFNKINKNEFRYTIDSLTTYDSTDVFVIGFTSLDTKEHDYSGRAYIKADDYALLEMKIYDENANEVLYDDCKISKIKLRFDLSFTKIADKYYLRKADLTTEYFINTDALTERITLIGGEFKDNSVADLNYDQRMIMYNEMINPIIFYTPDFWEQQNRPIDESITEDLNDEKTLYEQFKFNNGKRVIPLPDEYSNYEQMYKERDIFRMFLNANY